MTLANVPAFVPGQKPPSGLRMSYDEFLQADFDHPRYEWVDGEAVEMGQIEIDHNDIHVFLIMLLGQWIETEKAGRLLKEPFHMKAGPDLPGRCPDIMFIAAANTTYLERLTLRGPADLAVEIVSPSSRRVDRVEKFAEYERGGVKEYWIIDPVRRRADWYALVDGHYQMIDVDDDGRLQSKVMPGVWFRDVWFFERPAIAAVLKDWGIA